MSLLQLSTLRSTRSDILLSRFNQVTVAYDASKDDKLSALKAKKTEVEERLREKWTHSELLLSSLVFLR